MIRLIVALLATMALAACEQKADPDAKEPPPAMQTVFCDPATGTAYIKAPDTAYSYGRGGIRTVPGGMVALTNVSCGTGTVKITP